MSGCRANCICAIVVIFCFIFFSCGDGMIILFINKEQPVTEDPLIGEFLFSNNTLDTSRLGNSGTPFGGIVAVPDRFSNANCAYSFDGIRDTYITIPSNTLYNTSGTISFWIKTDGVWVDNVPLIDSAAIITRADSDSSKNGLSIVMHDPGHQIDIIIKDNSGILTEIGNIPLNNSWHFVVVTYEFDINGTVASYIDGVQNTLDLDIPLTWSFNNQSIRIGESTDAGWETFHGILDDFHLYNKIFSQAEVINQYNLEK